MAAAVPAWLRPNNVATERHQQLVFRHDADGSCAISMQELGNVCKTHYQACLSFLQNSHTTKGAPHDPPTIHALPKPPPHRS